MRMHNRSVSNWVDHKMRVYLRSRDVSFIDYDVGFKRMHLRHTSGMYYNLWVDRYWRFMGRGVNHDVGIEVNWGVTDNCWCNFDGWFNNGSEMATSIMGAVW